MIACVAYISVRDDTLSFGDGWLDGGCDGCSSLDSSVCSLVFSITTLAVSLNALVMVNRGSGGSAIGFSVNLTPAFDTKLLVESPCAPPQ